MPHKLIRPEPASSPSGGVSLSRTADRSIPEDLLREASKRLAIISLMVSALWIIGTVMWHVAWLWLNPGRKWPGLQAPEAIVAVGAATSLALYFYIRKRNREPKFLLRLGLVYMVVTCLTLSVMMHIGLPQYVPLQPQITWIGVVLVVFAAIIPITPREMLPAALLGAATGPLGMMITRVHGMGPLDALRTGVLMHYSDFLLAGVAVVISNVVTRLGQQVTKAREMGSYQLGDLIKRGGMGEVYRARHRMLARPAAIKLIRAEMLGAQDGEAADLAVRRFHREAEAAANLRSPHTVELFDFGITEDKTLYFVMELLDGQDLETLVKDSGPLPARRVIHILSQACESLEEAHEQGLVHRDIKPANIHIGKVGMKHDFVKVLDFGLVKSVAKDDSQVSLATAVGRTPGTPSYMAPEMALGESVDARADIYALGCVAYFMLTGKLVFDAETTFQMIAKHMRNEPVPPSMRSGVQIPQALEDLVLRCLRKSVDERPATARDIREALEAIRLPKWTEAEAAALFRASQPPAASSVEAPAGSDPFVAPAPASRFVSP